MDEKTWASFLTPKEIESADQSAETFLLEQSVAKDKYSQAHPELYKKIEDSIPENSIFVDRMTARRFGCFDASTLVFKVQVGAEEKKDFFLVITDSLLLANLDEAGLEAAASSQIYSEKNGRKTDLSGKFPIREWSFDREDPAKYLGTPATNTTNELNPAYFAYLVQIGGQAAITDFFKKPDQRLGQDIDKNFARVVHYLLGLLQYSFRPLFRSESYHPDVYKTANDARDKVKEYGFLLDMLKTLQSWKDAVTQLDIREVDSSRVQNTLFLVKLIDSVQTHLNTQVLNDSGLEVPPLEKLDKTEYQIMDRRTLARELQMSRIPPEDVEEVLLFIKNRGFISEVGKKPEFYKNKNRGIIAALESKQQQAFELTEVTAEEFVKSIHQQVLVEKAEVATQYRKFNNDEKMETIDHNEVEQSLEQFYIQLEGTLLELEGNSYIQWQVALFDLLVLHQQFIKIHPFDQGNGRTGRVLMNLMVQRLKQSTHLEQLVFIDVLPSGDKLWQKVRNDLRSNRANYYELLRSTDEEKLDFIKALLESPQAQQKTCDTLEQLVELVKNDIDD